MPSYFGRKLTNKRKADDAEARFSETAFEADYDADAVDHFRQLWKQDLGARLLPANCQVFRLTRYSELHPELKQAERAAA